MRIIDKFSDEEFGEHVANSSTFNELAVALGYKPNSGLDIIKRRIEEQSLDISHFQQQRVRSAQQHSKTRVWDYSSEEFANLVVEATSWSSLAKKLKFRNGYIPPSLHKRVTQEDIDISHFSKKKQGRCNRYETPLEEILVENYYFQSAKLRKRLIKEGILEEVCAICSLGPVWNDKPLTLQLDHINGNHNDNRLENLRIICPNCHTQTETYGAKRLKQPSKKCIDCSIEISRLSTRCTPCNKMFRKNNSKIKRRGVACIECGNEKPTRSGPVCSNCKENISKAARPSLVQLNAEIKKLGYIGCARKHKVSDYTIRKWVREYN